MCVLLFYATGSLIGMLPRGTCRLRKHVVNVADDCFLGEAGWNMLESCPAGHKHHPSAS